MTEKLSENDLILQRRAKLDALRKKGIAYPNTFRRDSLSGDLRNQYKENDYLDKTIKKKK